MNIRYKEVSIKGDDGKYHSITLYTKPVSRRNKMYSVLERTIKGTIGSTIVILAICLAFTFRSEKDAEAVGGTVEEPAIIFLVSEPVGYVSTIDNSKYDNIVEVGAGPEIASITTIQEQEETERIAAEEAAKKAAEEAAAALEARKQYAGKFTLTAYCSCKKCCGRWSPEVTGKASFTESGTNPKAGRTVAVDKSVIPLGTHIMINGHEYIAEDTGSAVDGKHIDIYFSSHLEARAFGSKKADVYILK